LRDKWVINTPLLEKTTTQDALKMLEGMRGLSRRRLLTQVQAMLDYIVARAWAEGRSAFPQWS